MADQLDTLEDKLWEEIEGQGTDVSPEMMRVIVAIASGALRKAHDDGRLRELFGVAAPMEGDLLELASRIMARIDGDTNPQLEAACVDYVFGLGLNDGKTQTAIASGHGVTRACVSARCIELREEFARPPARGMKSDTARESYRKRQLGKRARPAAEKWSFGGILTGIFRQPAAHGIA